MVEMETKAAGDEQTHSVELGKTPAGGFNRTSVPGHKVDLFKRFSQISITSGLLTEEERSRKYLEPQAEWAAQLIDKLTASDSPERMPDAVINACQGLAFINASKGGLVVTAARGYGFVIKKLSQDNYGNSTWSPPLFFTISQMGFGLAAGYQHSQSVLALVSLGAIEAFKQPTTTMGTDLALFSTDGALTGMGSGVLGHSNHMGMTIDKDKSAFCYSVADGAFLEISLHGTSIKPDVSTNRGLYKNEFTPDEIMDGKTGKTFSEMDNLIKKINAHGRKAMGMS